MGDENLEGNRARGKRTPGPYDPNEQGPVAGDVVVKKGNPVYTGGTTSHRAPRDVKLNYPLDTAEVGTGHN